MAPGSHGRGAGSCDLRCQVLELASVQQTAAEGTPHFLFTGTAARNTAFVYPPRETRHDRMQPPYIAPANGPRLPIISTFGAFDPASSRSRETRKARERRKFGLRLQKEAMQDCEYFAGMPPHGVVDARQDGAHQLGNNGTVGEPMRVRAFGAHGPPIARPGNNGLQPLAWDEMNMLSMPIHRRTIRC